MNPPKGKQEREATHAGASKFASHAIPVVGWEMVRIKPRATRRARPDAVVGQQARACYARARFYFGQIRLARKVHRTNKDRTKHRSTRLKQMS